MSRTVLNTDTVQKYLIWDFDGTLGYREGMWTGALLQVLRQHAPDCQVTADQLRPSLQTGYPWHEPHRSFPIRSADEWWEDLAPVFERAFMAAGITASRAACLAGEVRPAFVAPGDWHLFEDTIPTLAALSAKGWKQMILSNHVPELPVLVEHLGLGGHISRIFNSAETGYEKPHPSAFRNVLDVIGAADAVWMAGDSVAADVRGAEAVGIPAILVRKRGGRRKTPVR